MLDVIYITDSAHTDVIHITDVNVVLTCLMLYIYHRCQCSQIVHVLDVIYIRDVNVVI